MKLKIFRLFLIILILVMSKSLFSFSYQNKFENNEDENIRNELILETLRNGNMEERYSALVDINKNIKKYPLTDLIINEILCIAEREYKRKESVSMGELGEEYSSELIIALGNTQDSRAVVYLMENLGGGTLVARNLIKIGEPAIDPLIEKLHDKLIGFRISAAYALGEFLKQKEEKYVAKGEIKNKIKKALINELEKDRNKNPRKGIEWYEIRAKECASVRLAIVRALGYLAERGDTEVLPIIESIAKEDPYFLDLSKKKNYTGPEKRFIVREEATKVLEQLEGDIN